MDDGFEDYDTGPFCMHWYDPSDCELVCRCEHPCRRHADGGEDVCLEDECECEAFEDKDD